MSENTPDAPAAVEAGAFEVDCGNCGADVVFAPEADGLLCPYCGHVEEIEDATTPIVEYDLDAMLARTKRAPAEMAPRGREVACNHCGARAVLTTQADRCAFCDSPVVVVEGEDDDEGGMVFPESLLPFLVPRAEADTHFRDWLGSRWFAPRKLAQRAKAEGLDGVYVPFWTYDSQTATEYVGQRGEHYWETEYYEDANGNTQSRSVRRTRWYSASGTAYVDFDDVLVCASQSLPRKYVREVEPWDLGELKPYTPEYLSGFITERYRVDLQQGFQLAEARMEPVIFRAIREDIGGDEQRIWRTTVRHDNTTCKHILLPLWISAFAYKDRVYQVMVNARTGEVQGERPWSTLKIAMFCGLIAAIIVALFMQIR